MYPDTSPFQGTLLNFLAEFRILFTENFFGFWQKFSVAVKIFATALFLLREFSPFA